MNVALAVPLAKEKDQISVEASVLTPKDLRRALEAILGKSPDRTFITSHWKEVVIDRGDGTVQFQVDQDEKGVLYTVIREDGSILMASWQHANYSFAECPDRPDANCISDAVRALCEKIGIELI